MNDREKEEMLKLLPKRKEHIKGRRIGDGKDYEDGYIHGFNLAIALTEDNIRFGLLGESDGREAED